MIRRLLALMLLSAPAAANDTTATTGAGGLVLARTASIEMLSEDLFVSVPQVRVGYQFRNRSAQPVETIVAFPMPLRQLSREFGGDVAYPRSFHTAVDGRRVVTRLERKAIAGGRDQTHLLNRFAIPVAPDTIDRATAAMDRLPPAVRKMLVAQGLAGEETYDDTGKGMRKHLVPLWAVQDRYWWKQRFDPGRIVRIDHRYTPGAGGSVETPLGFARYRSSAEARETIARYCVDRAFLAALDRRAGKDPMAGPGLPDRRIDYILTTGGHWAAPIGRFRLVVDKGRERNLVSFCGEGVRKIGPTRFEMVKTNWRPDRDLSVLIVEPRD